MIFLLYIYIYIILALYKKLRVNNDIYILYFQVYRKEIEITPRQFSTHTFSSSGRKIILKCSKKTLRSHFSLKITSETVQTLFTLKMKKIENYSKNILELDFLCTYKVSDILDGK